jgi:PAS domain S-box-containing protein
MSTRSTQHRSIANGPDAAYPAHLTAAWGLVLAFVVTIATLWLRLAMTGPLGPTPMLVIFTVPIVLSAYFGGLRPGLLATALSCALSGYFLLPPLHSFHVTGISERWDLFFIALAGVTISVLTAALHRARSHGAVATSRQRQAEGALLTAGALQSAIFNSANFSSIATDAHGVIQIFNVGAERMLGYAAADVVNRINPADLSDSPELVARAAALSLEFGVAIAPGFEALVFKASRGIEDIYELTYIRKDKSRFPAVVSVTALRDAQDFIIGYLLIGTDNTARKQAEEELLKAGALQRAIFNSATFACIATDATGVIQIFNVGAERMMGYAAAEVVNKITPADLHDPQELVERAAALSLEFNVPIAAGFAALVFKAKHGIEDIYELTKVRRDGSRFPAIVSVTALRDAHEAIIGYLLIGTDNSARHQIDAERLRAEEARGVSEVRYRALFENAPDGILVADRDSRYLDVNDSICRMLGYTRHELIGLCASDIVAESELANIEPALVLIKSHGDYHREWRLRRKDGSSFPAEVIATVMPDGNLLAMIRDITERKRFEAAMQQQNVELVAASRMKSEFLANMSHELRTPLNSIIGFSEVLRDGLLGDMTDQQRGFIGDISGSGNHLLSLINDILDLSKVEAGKMELDLEPVEMSTLFENSLSILREKAAKNRIHVELDATDAAGVIEADPRKVKQIVYNLLSNAIKFSPVEGRVLLRARRVPRADVGKLGGSWPRRIVPLAANDFEQFIEIVVCDDGIGIAPEGLTQLFTPFSQIDSGLARKFEGTGLGLAMVKLLAELHGGTMAVESIVGEGSSFTVWLPVRGSEERAATVAGVSVSPRFGAPAGGRVALVVEGDPKSAELIRVQLVAEGFEVLHAKSAETALVLAVQQPLSLITLDIMLPKMDGWEFLSRIRRVPALRRVPVVIISIVADRTRGFALGAAAVMEKPISRQQLFEALADLGVVPLSPGKTVKVLVVDDDPKAVELIARRVERFAATVLRAYSGRQAIDLARQELPDVIVLDLMMPEISGFAVVEALREQPGTAGIPILVVTAKMITAEDRARLSGYVSTIMTKTEFGLEHFSSEVRRAMAGRHVEI